MDVLSSVINGMRTGRPVTYRVECHAPWGRRFPRQSGVSLHVVLRGSCSLLPADGGEPLALEMGDVALLPHGHAHAMAHAPDAPLEEKECVLSGEHCTPDGQAVVIGDPAPGGEPAAELVCGVYPLEQCNSHPVLEQLPESIHLRARLGHHPGLRAAVDMLAAELAEPQLGGHALRSSLFDAVLMYSLRSWYAESCSGHTGWGDVLTDPVVGRALEAMHTHPERPWTIESLGAHVGLSRAAFARRFTGLVGQAPLAYLTWWRMSLAARLLRDTDAPVADVARQAGYGSEFAFAGAFKREYRTTPARYRKREAAAPRAVS
ncbi:AraC family transcriptional regulator [Streptomyces sp. A7024]|uniref:AraC family transcriptional regulator n=1 Tax=Streptomyces coryli TaxID=1128680 RepID=A0A6G4UDT9_9ACTN|nr:AraC family transcriptional regulator [Streptomyces coryli]NGN69517.1 AraC family transcriptional regulator [Streptomyces coryli]